MKCSRCEKDLTNATYKVAFNDETLCWICYRKIPYRQRIKAIERATKN